MNIIIYNTLSANSIYLNNLICYFKIMFLCIVESEIYLLLVKIFLFLTKNNKIFFIIEIYQI